MTSLYRLALTAGIGSIVVLAVIAITQPPPGP